MGSERTTRRERGRVRVIGRERGRGRERWKMILVTSG